MCDILNIEFDASLLQNYKSEFRPKKIHYRKYYDNQTKRIVYEKHKKEFQIFGYKF